MNYKKLFSKLKKPRNIIFMLLFAFVLGSALNAISYQTGITGITSPTSAGCYCHYTSSNSNTTLSVSSESGSFTVAPGSETNFSITVTNTQSGIQRAGINLAVKTTETGNTNAGTLSTLSGSDIQVTSGEITHTQPNALSSGSKTFSFKWEAPNTPGSYWLRAVGNAVNYNGQADQGDQWNRMTSQEIIVYGLDIASPTPSDEFCPGESVDITWTHFGAQNLKIELSSNGGSSYDVVLNNSISADAEEWTWVIPNDITPGEQFRIRLTDTQNSEITKSMSGNFVIGEAAEITSHPSGTEACTGESLSLSVTATGALLTYQWKKDGANILNAVQATYNISSVSMSDAGEYTCVVSGKCGADITSNAAVVTVKQAPVIDTHPQNQAVCPNEDVVLSVQAAADGIQYQWQKNETDIPGATSSELILQNVSVDDAGSYRVIVSGTCPNTATSQGAIVMVYAEPEITQQPTNTSVCEGETATISVQATGDNLTYEWFKNGILISGETESSLVIESVSTDDEGTYRANVVGQCDVVESQDATLSVSPLAVISQHPQNQEVVEGEEVMFSVNSPTTGATYQWRKDDTPISGATSAQYSIAEVSMNDAGMYDCVVSNDCGERISNKAELSVLPAGDGATISLSLSTLNFGTLITNVNDKTEATMTIRNSGTDELVITGLNIGGNNVNDFSTPDIELPITLEPDSEPFSLTFEFQPLQPGERTATITFESNAINNPTLNLRGFSGIISLMLEETTIDFSEVNQGENPQMTGKIINQSNILVEIEDYTESGDVDAFEFIGSVFTNPLPEVLDPMTDYEFTVELVATEPGEYEATYTAMYENYETPITLTLKGSVISVSVKEIYVNSSIKIFPNPSNNEFNISIDLQNSNFVGKTAELRITDYVGNNVKTFENIILSETMNIVWDGKAQNGNLLPTGLYYLFIKTENHSENIPILINR